jgi:hypothetical protein
MKNTFVIYNDRNFERKNIEILTRKKRESVPKRTDKRNMYSDISSSGTEGKKNCFSEADFLESLLLVVDIVPNFMSLYFGKNKMREESGYLVTELETVDLIFSDLLRQAC